jgi:hypothetical protein
VEKVFYNSNKLTAISVEDIHETPAPEEASIPARVWTEHCGLRACLFRRKPEDNTVYGVDMVIRHVSW